MNAIMYAGAILAALVLTVERTGADVCVYKPPKVRRVCGTIVDPSGMPIPAASVMVLKDGMVLMSEKAGENGEFDFDVKKPGKYELAAAFPGFQHARYQLTLSRPVGSCKRALRIVMAVASIHCGGAISETKDPLPRKR